MMTISARSLRTIGFPALYESILPVLLSILGTVIVLFPSNPGNMTLPSRDSGVFLYVGWRLLNGDIPYRDVWDHKPPLIYFIDALGLRLTPNNLWGVWFMQFIFIFLTLFFIYRVLHLEFGTSAALAGTIVLTSGLLIVVQRGNVTEEYALVFQALCFWMFVNAWKKDFPVRASFWIGVLGGLAFNFKQTTIGLWVTYGFFLLAIRILHQRRFPLKDILSLLAGWLVPSIVLIIYLGNQSALLDFWEQAYLYNFAYIGKHEGLRRLIPVFSKGFAFLKNGWVVHLSVLGWLAAAASVWFKRKDPLAEIPPLVLIAIVNLPIEVLLILVSGRSILHYYLTALPVMAILAGMLVFTVPFLLGRIHSLSSPEVQKWISAIVLGVIVIGQFGQVKGYSSQYVQTLHQNDYTELINYIADHTEANDQVLLIGAESVVNFLARREAPTRYVYQYPLALLGRRPLFEEYFNEILENKPVMIVDTRGRARLDEKLYEHLQKRSEIVREGVKFLGENYQPVAQFGDWIAYRLVEK